MLRIAAAEDLTALTRLRRAATGDSAEDAAGWPLCMIPLRPWSWS